MHKIGNNILLSTLLPYLINHLLPNKLTLR